MQHTTLAFTPERLPLGGVAQAVWARDPGTVGQRATRKQRPIAEKESDKWLASLQAVNEARQACPQTHFVSVGDREAEVSDLLVAERSAGVDLLGRAAWDRRVEHPEQEGVRQRAATRAGRAQLRQRVAVEHRLAHLRRRQGRRARYKGGRKNLFDVRRTAAVLNLETMQRKSAAQELRIAA